MIKQHIEIYTLIVFHTSFAYFYYYACVTSIVGPYPDCSKFERTVSIEDTVNCHAYYICNRIDNADGSWDFKLYHMSCGQLYWDEATKRCDSIVPLGCDGDSDEPTTPSTATGKHHLQDESNCLYSSRVWSYPCDLVILHWI